MKTSIASIAALALAIGAAPMALGQGNGKGNGNGKGGKPSAAQKVGGQGAAKRGNGAAKQRGPDRKAQQMRDNGNSQGNRAVRANANQRGTNGPPAAKINRGNGNNGNANRGPAIRNDDRDGRSANVRSGDSVDIRVSDGGITVSNLFGTSQGRRVIDGCPPGLAKKYNGCQPPGQAKKNTSFGERFYRPAFFGLPLAAANYSYDDGFLIRLGQDGSISGYVPLLGGALAVGNPWPNYYEPVRVPTYYTDYYDLGPPNGYRYANNALYRVDPETAAITSVAALLTGDEFVVGQPVPRGYDVYNVPYAYRDRYFDRPDAYYRYSDGYVYQIDPETRLVAAAIELLI